MASRRVLAQGRFADLRVPFSNTPSFSAPGNPLWGRMLGRTIPSVLGSRDDLRPSLKAQASLPVHNQVLSTTIFQRCLAQSVPSDHS